VFASHGRASRPLFIEPGSPWENGYVENFNDKLRDELLDREISYTIWEAQVLIETWRRNMGRPRSQMCPYPNSTTNRHPTDNHSICNPYPTTNHCHTTAVHTNSSHVQSDSSHHP
jgi:hypothetical protein